MTVFNIVKWPIIALIVSQIFAFLDDVGPNVKQPGFRWVSPGGIVASCYGSPRRPLFAFYVSNFGSYSKTYGSHGGRDHLPGLALDHQHRDAARRRAQPRRLERGRQIEAGHPPEREPSSCPCREAPKPS